MACDFAGLAAAHLFFFNDTATTEIYTLSLHDALPIWKSGKVDIGGEKVRAHRQRVWRGISGEVGSQRRIRSEEHTSELQSHLNLVCRLLLEKKRKSTTPHPTYCPLQPEPCPRTPHSPP